MRWVFFVLVCGLLSAGPLVAKESTTVASVLDIDGPRLMTNRLQESRWFQAYPGMEAFLSEKLRSDPQTTACLEFVIGGRAVIAPDSEVEISGQRGVTQSGNTLTVKAGRVWAKIDKQNSQLQIKTSGGVIGIEGTEFLLEVTPVGETEITMLEGEVSLTGDGGHVDRLRAGQSARMGRGGIRRLELAKAVRESLAAGDVEAARVALAASKLPPSARRAVLRGALHKKGPHRRAVQDSEKRRRKPIRGKRRRAQEVEQTFLLTATGEPPVFSWSGAPSQNGWFFGLWSEEDPQGAPIWSSTSSGTSTSYPAYGPALTAGEYLCKVWAVPTVSEQALSSAPEGFESAVSLPAYQRRELSPLALKVERLADGRPSFLWSGQAALAAKVEVEVVDSQDTSRVHWRGSAPAVDGRVEFPLEARALSAGEYMLRARAFDSDSTEMAGSNEVIFPTSSWRAAGVVVP